MSERKKLEEKWLLEQYKGCTVLPKDMIIELGKLVEQCPHNKTHWVQELDSEGVFKNKLFKRCFLCGFNIDELDVDEEFREGLLSDFDKRCEEKKLLVKAKT